MAATLALLAALAATSVAPAAADAASFRPRKGKVFHGTSDTGFVRDFNSFERQVDAHPALLQVFFHWGVPLTTGALDRWERTETRGVLSLSTAPGDGREVITPRQIANGRDDHYMLRLNESIHASGQVVYIRPFAEMNGHWNPYSAFNADGSARRNGHSTKWFRQAWRRFVTIVRGGSRDRINRRLRALGLPRIHRARGNRSAIYERRDVPRRLGRPKVAFMWVPQTRGSPDVPGNTPRSYWPGGRYVDWVGADVYAKYGNATLWRNLSRFYRQFRRWPFVIGEYAAWDNDHQGAFVRRLFRWARKRKRADALLYFRSVDPDNEFNLQHYPGARRSLRRILDRRRYVPYAAGTRRTATDGDGGTAAPR